MEPSKTFIQLVDLVFERKAEGTWLNRVSISSLALAVVGVVAIAFSFSLALKVSIDNSSPVRYQTEMDR